MAKQKATQNITHHKSNKKNKKQITPLNKSKEKQNKQKIKPKQSKKKKNEAATLNISCQLLYFHVRYSITLQ